MLDTRVTSPRDLQLAITAQAPLAAMDIEINLPVPAWTATATDLCAEGCRSQRSGGDRIAEQHDAYRRETAVAFFLVALCLPTFTANARLALVTLRTCVVLSAEAKPPPS